MTHPTSQLYYDALANATTHFNDYLHQCSMEGETKAVVLTMHVNDEVKLSEAIDHMIENLKQMKSHLAINDIEFGSEGIAYQQSYCVENGRIIFQVVE